MSQPQSDADVERLVRQSAAFRAVRTVLLALDEAVASSTVARAISRRFSVNALGVVLLAASVTHASIVALVPAGTAPAGRYLFAVGGALAGALLLAAPRTARGRSRPE